MYILYQLYHLDWKSSNFGAPICHFLSVIYCKFLPCIDLSQHQYNPREKDRDLLLKSMWDLLGWSQGHYKNPTWIKGNNRAISNHEVFVVGLKFVKQKVNLKNVYNWSKTLYEILITLFWIVGNLLDREREREGEN